MPLTFDDRGLLAPGTHDATLAEVEQIFARFQHSDRRIKLFGKLKTYLAELEQTGWVCQVILDGSFVMLAVDEPNDIDLILVLPADWDMFRDLRPFEYNVVSRARTRKTYGIDVTPVPAGTVQDARARLFFEQVRVERCRELGWPEDTKKGLVRVVR